MVGIFGLQIVASERIEVVELHTLDDKNKTLITRLWVVDYKGHAYLRSGGDTSGWFQRLSRSNTIVLSRNDSEKTYTTAIKPEFAATLNQLMQEKYTWGDTIIGFLFGREETIAIQLTEI